MDLMKWKPLPELSNMRRQIERACGSFSRVIPIPVGVDTGKIVAECDKGVLEVHLPKKEEAKAKEIPVKVKL